MSEALEHARSWADKVNASRYPELCIARAQMWAAIAQAEALEGMAAAVAGRTVKAAPVVFALLRDLVGDWPEGVASNTVEAARVYLAAQR